MYREISHAFSHADYFHISLLVLIFMVVVIFDGIPSIRFDEAKYRISYGNHIQRAVRWRHAFAQPPLCPPELHVVAFVISSPANRERRDRIRDTWANPAYHPRRDFK
ncbi:uncharacterized protein LOC122267969 [Penaeus japonicus]|uniref:uncharacterized protein LOC122267969 n=1 Tax=Penaeus japonicus TaxID=27405 RepID=UPI001C713E88|nr:uncharacterized protein LOC122267969 [Penaeus japonicus]